MVQRQNLISIATITALCVVIGGAAVLAIKSNIAPENPKQAQAIPANPKSQVLPLVALSVKERALQLSAIALLPPSMERDRARYLLASDLIAQKQGEKALPLLENLEQSYPVLAAPIALKRAQAADNSTQWQELLKNHSSSPVATEALFVLGKTDQKYWESAIAKYPTHPRSLEIARNLLTDYPNRTDLMLLVVKNSIPPDIAIADKLVPSGAKLTPTDWEVISTAYWTTKNYGKAALAYSKASRTPLNLYRKGRSLQVSDKKTESIATYQQLIGFFPTAKESGLALTQLAAMAKNESAIAYLDRVIAGFPKLAGAALAAKAEILDAQNKNAATQARNVMLKKYGDSEAAAEYRWKIALEKAEAQNYQQAWQWAQTIPTRNPKSILAARAGFWVGKWAEKLGKKTEAKAAYEYVLSQFPQSYYAWRSAVNLGLNVGNFTTVRQINPQVIPPERVSLSAGSATLKELYQLGQDNDALALWQVEFTNKTQPTLAEQFTDGVMSLAKGDNLLGINKIATLEDRETPPEQAEYQALSQKLTYWQARYPFPFLQEIEYWAGKRQINPLLVTALIRQESRFEPKIRSVAGAVGLMQVMPGTGEWIAEKIKLEEYNSEIPKDNILLGTWFLNYTHEQYNNNSLFAIASYNAGPNAVSKWRDRFDISDPDEFVEAIPYEETKGYVRQVFGNYWNYLRLYNPEISQLVSSYSTTHPKAASLP
ncbi:transglycosylase SLT domain-containing protein [Synechocystis sp. PCC 7509]|uniref:lytic transglycosylase domain-containing protein n=1 Tax=Synechocystis sp. PCC 7509 TaxID=927677 RepID=UPI0002AC68F2|nr:transglycosylase SLT domain-containing protein [Synechocystis sp. PCC 7509]